MNATEATKALAVVQAIWPKFAEGRNLKVIIQVWAAAFADCTEQQVEAAVLAFAASDTKGFPPAPGALKAIINQARTDNRMSETEAWTLVSRALRNGLYGANEEFAKLPADVQSVLGGPSILRDWAMLSESEVQTVIASNFQRSYRARILEQDTHTAIPEVLRQALGGGNGGTSESHGLIDFTDRRAALPV